MKILFTRFPLESTYGGAEVQVLSLMEGLMKRGYAVAFLGSCPILLKECRERNIPFAELAIGPPPVTKWGAVSFFWRKQKMQKLLQAAIKEFYDLDAVIMLSLSEKLLLTPLVSKPSPGPNPSTKAFWLEHDRVGKWLTKNPWLERLRRLSKNVTTIVVSELSKEIYVELGWNPGKVVAIPNGIDPKRLEKTKNQKPKTKNSLIHIGCVARLTHDKGVDLLIEAVQDLPDVKLTIVGTGREERQLKRISACTPKLERRRESALARRSLNEGGNQRISFLPHIDDIGSFYRSLDILVLPSREHDPFGLVAAEAMTLGVPVIVTTVCGIASYLKNCEDAVIVKAGSVQALKEGITMLLSSEKKRKEIGNRGKETAMEKFSVGRMVEEYGTLLSK